MQKFDSAHTKETLGSRKRASIVVLDSSPISLLALAGVLDSQGYSCICARDRRAAVAALEMGTQELMVCDVGEDCADVLATLEEIRSIAGYELFPAVLIAGGQWSGLEKQVEALRSATRCLFKPIDPNSLIAVVDQLLWMPSLVAAHRRRGSSPSRPGWITL
jgi:DNA-binding NtrC family response regulator